MATYRVIPNDPEQPIKLVDATSVEVRDRCIVFTRGSGVAGRVEEPVYIVPVDSISEVTKVTDPPVIKPE